MPEKGLNVWLVALVLALFVGLFYNLGGPPLFDRDEGAFSEATREFFSRGDFFFTYLNGEPRYDKPILIYWLQAFFVWLLGVKELSFRLPSALAAALWVVTLARFIQKRFGFEKGMFTGMLCTTAFGVMLVGRAAIADAVLNLFLVLSMVSAYQYLTGKNKRDLYCLFAFSALGFLTKGPVAVLIPFAVTFLYCLITRDLKTWFKGAFNPLGILIFVCIAAPWYAYILHREGMAFVQGFFLKHNVERFSGTLEGHGGGLLYYVPVFLVLCLPYTALLVRVLPRIRFAKKDALDLFCWVWAGFVFVFFSFSGTKLPHYGVLGLSPLILLMARYQPLLTSRFWALFPAVLLLAVLFLLPHIVSMAVGPLAENDPFAAAFLQEAGPHLGASYLWVVGAGLAALAVLFGVRRWGVAKVLAAAGLIQALVIAHAVVPAVGRVMQGPVKEAALLARAKNLDVVAYGLDHPSISVYREAVTPDRKPLPGESAITRVTYLNDRIHEYKLWYRKGGIALITLGGKDRPPGGPDGLPAGAAGAARP